MKCGDIIMSVSLVSRLDYALKRVNNGFMEMLCFVTIVKFRTRRNSATVQMRGRRLGSIHARPQPGIRTQESFRRQSSKEQDLGHHPHSPSRTQPEQPSFTSSIPQVMITRENASFHKQVVADSQATGRGSQLPEIPSLETYKPKPEMTPLQEAAETGEEGEHQQEEGAGD